MSTWTWGTAACEWSGVDRGQSWTPRQKDHLCWTLQIVCTMIHGLFKNLPFQASTDGFLPFLFLSFFFFPLLSSAVFSRWPAITLLTKTSEVHGLSLWGAFYKDILEKRIANLWGKWIRLWENSSKQRSSLPSKFRLNAHELLSYLLGLKSWGRITELTVRLLQQTVFPVSMETEIS